MRYARVRLLYRPVYTTRVLKPSTNETRPINLYIRKESYEKSVLTHEPGEVGERTRRSPV